MEFSVGGGAPVQNPTPEQIEAGLASLTGEGDSFAILAQSQMTYMQTSGSASGGFLLEYQDGSLEQHFRSTSYELPLSTVSEAFRLYSLSDPAWHNLTSWEREDLTGGGGAGLLPIALAVAAIAAVVLWWFRAA